MHRSPYAPCHMEIAVVIIFACISDVLMQIAPFFLSPAYIAFFVVFMTWPLVNIWMILRYPVKIPETASVG